MTNIEMKYPYFDILYISFTITFYYKFSENWASKIFEKEGLWWSIYKYL